MVGCDVGRICGKILMDIGGEGSGDVEERKLKMKCKRGERGEERGRKGKGGKEEEGRRE